MVAPALPPGWTSTATGVEVPWVTSTTNPSSAPNDAFAPDPSNIGNTELVSELNTAIDGIRASGEYEKISEKYFKSDIYGE